MTYGFEKQFFVVSRVVFQPTAESNYAQENPFEEVLHKGVPEANLSEDALEAEKIDNKRSGLGTPHFGHCTGSLSVVKTICSNL